MLDHHPQIAFQSEFELTVDLLPDNEGWPPLEQYYEWLETHRIFLVSGFTIDRSLSYPELMNSFLLQTQNKDKKPFIGATVHRHIDQLLRIWPQARFIHLFRDGRDVASSIVRMGWAGNVWTGVERWIDVERGWETLCTTLLPYRYVEVQFEKLVCQPEIELTRICEFIGAPFDLKMLDYPKTSTYQPPDPSLTQQWRHTLSDWEIRLAEARISDMLTARGYQLSDLSPLQVSRVRKRSLQIQDKLARIIFRMRRLGVLLWAADYLARHSGITAWSKLTQMKINAIETRYLK